MDASEDTRGYFISRTRGLLIVFLILGVTIGPQMLEPKDVMECESVTVMSYHQRLRSQLFAVAIGGTDKVREVGAANTPFAHEYRGPAVLVLRRGRWTGGEHWRLYASCPKSDA
jgi:hypothetical protein